MALYNNKIFKNLKQSKYLELLPNLKEEKTQKFTSIVLTLIALSFFGIFAISPTISTIARLQKEVSDSNFTEEQLKQKITNLSTLGQEYQRIQQDIPYVLFAIPQDPQISTLVAQIQALSQQSNIQLNGLQTLQVEVATQNKTQKKYSAFSFSVAAEGQYENIISFIESLKNMQRITSLDTIALNKKTDQNKTIQLSIKGTAYFKE